MYVISNAPVVLTVLTNALYRKCFRLCLVSNGCLRRTTYRRRTWRWPVNDEGISQCITDLSRWSGYCTVESCRFYQIKRLRWWQWSTNAVDVWNSRRMHTPPLSERPVIKSWNSSIAQENCTHPWIDYGSTMDRCHWVLINVRTHGGSICKRELTTCWS